MQKNFGEFLFFQTYDGLDFSDYLQTTTSRVFQGMPLAWMAPASRGKYISQWIRDHDNDASDPIFTPCSNGQRMRGRSNAAYDYIRGKTRVEVKTSQMAFNRATNRWNFHFQNIIQDNFDELRLAFYTPRGIYVYVH